MKTERDLFREWYENAYHEIINILPSGQYASLRQQHSWDAWTASAQREGYKLVPVENLIDIQVSCENAFEINNIDIFKGLALAIIDETKAMIGAAE